MRPIAKRGDEEVSGFHDVMERFVPLHDFEEMEGFGEMSKEEQEAILRAQAEVEQRRVSSMNKRMFFSALIFAGPAVIAVTILALHAMKGGEPAPDGNGGGHTPRPLLHSIVEAKSLARKIDAAKSIEEMAEFTRQPAASLPRMRKYYERVVFRPNQLIDLQSGSAGEIELLEDDFLWLMATTDSYDNRMLAFEKTGTGLKFDWESYVNYSEVPWTDFVDQQHPRRGEFRVTLAKDNYYNYAFADETKFRCYRLTDPDHLRTCYGYTPRGVASSRHAGGLARHSAVAGGRERCPH